MYGLHVVGNHQSRGCMANKIMWYAQTSPVLSFSCFIDLASTHTFIPLCNIVPDRVTFMFLPLDMNTATSHESLFSHMYMSNITAAKYSLFPIV